MSDITTDRARRPIIIWDPNASNPYGAEVARVLSSSTHRLTRYGRQGSGITGFAVNDRNIIPVSGEAASSLAGAFEFLQALLFFAVRALVSRDIVVLPWITTLPEKFAFLLLTLFRKSTILVVHNPVNGRYTEMSSFLLRVIHRRAGVVVVHRQDLVSALGPCRKSAVVEHPTYLAWRRRVAAGLGPALTKPPRVALFLGETRIDKGAEYLIPLAAELKRHRMTLQIASGKVSAELWEKLAKTENIELIGTGERYLTDSEVANTVLSANVLVVPYLNTTASGTVILAATLGLPVVGFRDLFLPRYAGDDFCVEVGDIGELALRAARLSDAYRDPQPSILAEVEIGARRSWESALAEAQNA